MLSTTEKHRTELANLEQQFRKAALQTVGFFASNGFVMCGFLTWEGFSSKIVILAGVLSFVITSLIFAFLWRRLF